MTDTPPIHARKRPPRALEAAGRKLWRAVLGAYELRPDELIVLETACSCADLVAKLEAAMAGQPLVVKGSMGQEREHPLLSEQRQQRALLNRSLAQLRLPDVDGVDRGASARSVAARRAAQSRWAGAPWAGAN
jgi:hypothetical protein